MNLDELEYLEDLDRREEQRRKQKRSYMQEVDAWLRKLLLRPDIGSPEWFERVKQEIKDKLLESYRNGQAAGPAKRPFRKPTQK